MYEFFQQIAGKNKFVSKLGCFAPLTLAFGRSYLVRGGSGSGCTAVALDLVKEFLDQGATCIIFDSVGDIHDYRIKDMMGLPLAILYPSGVEQFFDTLLEFDPKEEYVILFDASYIHSQDESAQFKSNLDNLRIHVSRLLPKATIIVTERETIYPPGFGWSETILVTTGPLLTESTTRERIGHWVDLSTPNGKTRAFVDYSMGRLSRVFDFYLYTHRSRNAFMYAGTKWYGSHQAIKSLMPTCEINGNEIKKL